MQGTGNYNKNSISFSVISNYKYLKRQHHANLCSVWMQSRNVVESTYIARKYRNVGYYINFSWTYKNVFRTKDNIYSRNLKSKKNTWSYTSIPLYLFMSRKETTSPSHSPLPVPLSLKWLTTISSLFLTSPTMLNTAPYTYLDLLHPNSSSSM